MRREFPQTGTTQDSETTLEIPVCFDFTVMGLDWQVLVHASQIVDDQQDAARASSRSMGMMVLGGGLFGGSLSPLTRFGDCERGRVVP